MGIKGDTRSLDYSSNGVWSKLWLLSGYPKYLGRECNQDSRREHDA